MTLNHESNPTFSLDHDLFCPERNFDEETHSNLKTEQNPFPVVFQEHDLFNQNDDDLSFLFSKEKPYCLTQTLESESESETESCLVSAWNESVGWIVKVVAHYSFSASTTLFSLNYLDRFLFSVPFQKEKPWVVQLAAVACLSIAAKMEETYVPLLLDLQVEESEYVFEAKTIQKMEILVLATLEWKMNPVTPLCFIDFITMKLRLKDRLCWEFINRCQHTLLSLISDSKFMHYLPSVLASATTLHVVSTIAPSIGFEYRDQLLCILKVDKEKVEECLNLVIKSSMTGGGSKKRKYGSVPGSPNGVMEASFSSDNSNDSWVVTTTTASSLPPALLKKNKVNEKQLFLERFENEGPSNFRNIPR